MFTPVPREIEVQDMSTDPQGSARRWPLLSIPHCAAEGDPVGLRGAAASNGLVMTLGWQGAAGWAPLAGLAGGGRVERGRPDTFRYYLVRII